MSAGTTFGPGTFTIGPVGSEIEASCLVNSLTVTPSKDVGDSTTKLCGTKVPGAVTYTYTLDGNVDLDSDDAAGFFAFTQEMAGTEQQFTFTPNTTGVTAAAGTVVVDPLEFGGDTYGDNMTSDFSFDLVDAPTYTFPTDTPLSAGNRFAPVVVGTPTVVKPAPAKASTTKATADTAAA